MEITMKEWKALYHVLTWTQDVLDCGEMDETTMRSPSGIAYPSPEEYEIVEALAKRAEEEFYL